MESTVENKQELREDVVRATEVKRKRANAWPVAIVVALITAAGGIIVALIGYAASTYEARHPNMTTVSSGKTGTLTFKKASASKSVSFDITPDAGKLYVSARQSSGAKNTKYKVYYKKSSSKSFGSAKATFKLSSNNVFSPEKKIGTVKKNVKYNCKVSKTSNYSTQSKIEIDWLLQ